MLDDEVSKVLKEVFKFGRRGISINYLLIDKAKSQLDTLYKTDREKWLKCKKVLDKKIRL